MQLEGGVGKASAAKMPLSAIKQYSTAPYLKIYSSGLKFCPFNVFLLSNFYSIADIFSLVNFFVLIMMFKRL